MTPIEKWRVTTVSGLSLLNFLEQNLDDRELAVCLDGWLAWTQANAPPGIDTDKEIAGVMNAYSRSCEQEGGPRLTAQRRLIGVFKERNIHG